MLEKGHFALFVFLCLAAFGHFIFLYSFCKVLSAFDVCHRAGRGRIGDAAILISIFSIFSSFKGLTARSIDEHIDPSETSHDGQVFPRFPDATPQRTSRFLFFFSFILQNLMLSNFTCIPCSTGWKNCEHDRPGWDGRGFVASRWHLPPTFVMSSSHGISWLIMSYITSWHWCTHLILIQDFPSQPRSLHW